MGLFYWNLDNKKKFIRSLWFGLLALILLYIVLWFYVDDWTVKFVIAISCTFIYIIELIYRNKKMKSQ